MGYSITIRSRSDWHERTFTEICRRAVAQLSSHWRGAGLPDLDCTPHGELPNW